MLVRAVYQGANPKVLAETVAAPLEQAINGVEHMLYMKSVSSSDGTMQLTVTFRPGTDPDGAQVQVQNRVSQALARLPEDVRRQGVVTQKQSSNITLVVHLLSPDDRYDAVYLLAYAAFSLEGAAVDGPSLGRAFARLLPAGDAIEVGPNGLFDAISALEAEVCWREAACSEEPWARDWLEPETWPEAFETCSAFISGLMKAVLSRTCR